MTFRPLPKSPGSHFTKPVQSTQTYSISVFFMVLHVPKASWSALVVRNCRVTSSGLVSSACPWVVREMSWPLTTISWSTPLESANSRARSMKNQAVRSAAWIIRQSIFSSPMDSAPATSCLPSHLSICTVTPSLLGRLTECFSSELRTIHSRCIFVVVSPCPALLCASLMANTACFIVAADVPNQPK